MLWARPGKNTRETDLPSSLENTCHRLNWLFTLLFKCQVPLRSRTYVFLCQWKKNETLRHGWVCDCLLSFFISLCKHSCVGGISLFLDARVHFFHAKVSWNSYQEWHTRGALVDTESRATKTPLMKQAKEPLMLCEFMRLIPAALCSSGPSSYGLSHQIRNDTCTPPLFLNNNKIKHIMFASCLSTT